MRISSPDLARSLSGLIFFLFFLLAFVNTAAFSQVLGQLTQQDPIGIPPNAATEGDNEQIVLSNGSVNMFVPVLSLPQRGGSTLTLGYTYNSNQFSLFQDVGVTSNEFYDSTNSNCSEQGECIYDNVSYTVSYGTYLSFPDPMQINLPQLRASLQYVGDAPGENCNVEPCTPIPESCLMNWVFTDWSGATHKFGVVSNCTVGPFYPPAPMGIIPQSDAEDGTLLNLDTTNVATATTQAAQTVTVTTAAGTVYTFSGVSSVCPSAPLGIPCSGGGTGDFEYQSVASSIVDPNGNKISIETQYNSSYQPSYTLTDTIGRVVTISPFAQPAETITYKDSNGTLQTISYGLQSIQNGPDVQSFPDLNCTVPSSGNIPSTQYSLSVSPGPTIGDTRVYTLSSTAAPGRVFTFWTNDLGQLLKVQYPSGGYHRFDYQMNAYGYPGGGALSCVSDTYQVFHRYECRNSSGVCPQEDVTTYVPTFNADVFRNSEMDVTDPNGNLTQHFFNNLSYASEYKVLSYAGTSKLLRTVLNLWFPMKVNDSLLFLNNDGGEVGSILVDTSVIFNDVSPFISYTVNYGYDTIAETIPAVPSLNQASGTVSVTTPNLSTESNYDFDGSLLKSTWNMWDYDPALIANHILNRQRSSAITEPMLGNTHTISHTYDGFGNVTSTTDSGTNAVSNTITYTPLDPYGRPTQSVDSLGHTYLYSYDTDLAWSNSACAPPSGSAAYLTSVTDPTGAKTTYKYNSCTGTLGSTTDPNLQPTYYSYDGLGRTVATNYPDGGETNTCYVDTVPNSVTTDTALNASGTSGMPTCQVTGNNFVNETVLDGLGRKSETELLSDPYGALLTQTMYDKLGNVASVTNPYRTTGDTTYGVTSYSYDALNRMTLKTNPDNSIRQWCYDDLATTGQTNCHALVASSTGEWVDITDEKGNDWQQTKDAMGRMTSVVEPNGTSPAPSMETDYTYDGFGNLVSVYQWGGPASSPAPNGPIVRSFFYDGRMRLLTANNPEVGLTTYTYDTDSNLITKVSPLVNAPINPSIAMPTQTIGYCYDALNRVTYKFYSAPPSSCTNPTGYAAFFLYDNGSIPGASNDVGRLTGEGAYVNGTLTAIRTPFQYDPMGRLTYEQQIPLNQNVRQYWFLYAYDLAGDMTCTNNGIATFTSGNTCTSYTALHTSMTTSYTYDAAQRLSTLTAGDYCSTPPCAPFAQTALYTATNYGPAGITAATYGNGFSLSRAYDDRMRVVDHQVYQTGAAQATGSITISGSLASGDSGSVKVTLAGVELSVPYSATTNSTQAEVANALIAVINQSPEVIATCANTPCWAKVTAEAATTSSTGAVTIPLSAILEGTIGDVAITASATTSASFTVTDSGSTLTGGSGSEEYYYQLAYKSNGNLNSSNDLYNSSYQYNYDTLNRVTEAAGNAQGLTVAGAHYDFQCWSYDAFGNRTGELDQSPYCPQSSSGYMTATTYNSSNQVVTTNANTTGTLTYDIAGNVINDGVNNYVYDPDGRICAVQNLTSLAAWQYVYDAEGRRVGKGTINTWPGTGTGATCAAPTTANGFTLTNIYLRGESGDQDTELDGSDDWIHTNIFAGGGLTATYWNNNGTQELSYIYSDWLSTKRAQFDSTGTLQTYWQSDPFGDYMTTHGTGGDASELHFTGKERDTESGNDYFGARYYASSMGRFMSPDPVFATVDRIADPQQWNMYAYAGNNPLMNTDPSGLDFNLTCSGGNTATCQGGLQGQTTTDANGKSTFTATDVDMNDPKDAGAGYHDQFGNQYTGSFDQNSGVSFTNTATGDTSSNSRFIDGSDRTDVNGSGAFNGIQGQFNSNCGGSCEAKGSLYNLPGHDGAVAALEKMIGKSFEDNLNFFGGHGKANNYRFGDGQLTHIVDHLDGKNKGKQEIHFEGHAPGSNLQNFVLHQVDAIRDSANHQSAQEPNLP